MLGTGQKMLLEKKPIMLTVSVTGLLNTYLDVCQELAMQPIHQHSTGLGFENPSEIQARKK